MQIINLASPSGDWPLVPARPRLAKPAEAANLAGWDYAIFLPSLQTILKTIVR